MDKLLERREEVLEGLAIVLENIYSVAFNKLVSVTDHSVNKMLEEVGINRNYGPSMVKVLQSKGFYESEGTRGGLRYKIVSEVYPDYAVLAKEVYEERYQRNRAKAEARKTNFPFHAKPTPKIDDDFVGEIVKVKSKKLRKVDLPNLLDTRYIIFNGEICECKIVACKYSEENNKFFYDIKRKSGGTDIVEYDYELNNLWENPKDLVEHLLKNIVKL